MRTLFILAQTALLTVATVTAYAQQYDELPTINPTATYTTENGEEESEDYSGNAPLAGRFEARPIRKT